MKKSLRSAYMQEKDEKNVALFELFENGDLLLEFAERYMRNEDELDSKLLKLEQQIKKQRLLENAQTRKTHKATDEEIKATYKKGGSLLTMAKRIGISTTQLINKGKRLGLYPRPSDLMPPSPTPQATEVRKHKIDDQEFIDYVKRGPVSWRALSVHFNVSMDCVIATAKRLKVQKMNMNHILKKLTRAKLLKALEKKRSWKTIALDLGVSISLVMKKAKEWGLTKERMKPGAKRKPLNQ